MFKSFIDPLAYGYAVGRVRVRENKLLREEFFEQLIAAGSFSEQLNLVEESECGLLFEDIEEDSQERLEIRLEEALESALELTYEFLEETSPFPEINNFFRIKYDFHNLKLILKSDYWREDGAGERLISNLGVTRFDELKKFADKEAGEDDSQVYALLARVFKKSLEIKEEKKDLLLVDILLDKNLCDYRSRIISSLGSPFLSELFQRKVDLANIKAFLRAKVLGLPKGLFLQMLLDHGALESNLFLSAYEGSYDGLKEKMRGTPYPLLFEKYLDKSPKTLQEFDLEEDNLIMDHLRQGKHITVGPELLLNYVLARELEIKLLRIILLGSLHEVPKETMKKRMRILYV